MGVMKGDTSSLDYSADRNDHLRNHLIRLWFPSNGPSERPVLVVGSV